MNHQIKKTIIFYFYPLVAFRRWVIKQKKNYLGHHNPEKLAKLLYRRKFHKELNLNNPQTFNEKVNWLKFRSDTSLWTELADKYKVREYIKNNGLEEILVKLYGKWDRVEDIDFEQLPNSFVLKSNNGCGTVLLVEDKTKLDLQATRKLLKKWLKQKYGYTTAEPHYTTIKPCIIAEEYLKWDNPSISSSLIDYKFHCIHGSPLYIQVMSDRQPGHIYHWNIYNTFWQPYSGYIPPQLKKDSEIPCPQSFERMLDICKILSKPFPQVRIDLYEIGGKIYFGEMTFTSAGGYDDEIPNDLDVEMGEKMNLPVEKRMVKRIRNTTPQKELNDVERKINLKKAFQLVPNIVKYKKILIVDDIYTTGSTIDAVAEVLLQAGVDEIYFLCISIGEGF